MTINEPRAKQDENNFAQCARIKFSLFELKSLEREHVLSFWSPSLSFDGFDVADDTLHGQ